MSPRLLTGEPGPSLSEALGGPLLIKAMLKNYIRAMAGDVDMSELANGSLRPAAPTPRLCRRRPARTTKFEIR
jgi:hypothetical protein